MPEEAAPGRTERIGSAELKYLREVLEGGFRASKVSSMTTRFERAFAEKFGSRFAVAHANGTATLHTALASAGVGEGDEVIVPPLTMASTTLAVLYQNATPVFADVDPDTFTLSPESVARSISDRTRAIIPVALYGLPPDMDPIMELAGRHGLKVIEDNAQCYLGRYKGRLAGKLGHMASFSLQASKHITSGEGGVVITDDEDLADKVRAFSVVGYDVVKAKNGAITKSVLQDPEFPRHAGFGFKYKMSDLCAAVALGQLERLEELVEVRRRSWNLFREVTSGSGILAAQKLPPDCENSCYTFAARLPLDGYGILWKQFRSRFLENGGHPFYAAWRLTYHEPMWDTGDFRIRRVVGNPVFRKGFREYWKEKCPDAERVQPRIVQLKTNYYRFEDAERQADALARTLRSFS
jgi:perosamine synthetase